MSSDASFLKLIAKIYKLLPRRRKLQFPLLIGLILSGAFAEILTLSMVFPFIDLITNKDSMIESVVVTKLIWFFKVNDGADILALLTILFIAILILSGAIRTIMTWFLYRFSFGLGYDFTVEIYKRTLLQEYRVHLLRNSSEVLGGINKAVIMVGNVVLPMMKGLAALIMSLSIVSMLFFINYSVTLSLIFLFIIIYILLSKTVKSRLRENSVIIANGQSFRVKSVQEGLGGIRDIILDSSQSVFIKRFENIEWGLRRAQGNNGLIADIPRYVIEAFSISVMCILAYKLSFSEGGVITSLPIFGAFALAAQKLIPLMQMVYVNWTQVSGNYAVISDVIKLLDQPIPLNKSDKKIQFNYELVLKKVHFKYESNNKYALKDISIEIAKGMKVGFIGKTGSGKSTLLDIIMGLLQPSNGIIEVDGIPLDPYNISAWQSQVAHVPQDVYICDLSIAENVALGINFADIDFRKLDIVIQRAELSEFVAKQEKGLNTVLGEQGALISGGERQRIGIARALYKEANVLILDEATSALDDKTEKDIMLNIDDLRNDITVLIIAHRLSTLSGCDLIFRLDNGKLVEKGSYNKIIVQNNR
ncbi:ABC transporter ATP-binding protein/permease [Methylophilaceae bacterium]|nr:ABC transporter ATP-binding protein/permease [Methylophilaceae bacterium]